MDWRDIPSLTALRAFEAAARLQSFSAAARDLNVTHAAIAQNVRALEDHFGTPLMTRQGRRMAVTPEGQQLASALSEGFGIIGAATADLANRGKSRALRIAVTPSFAANWLMPRIGDFWTRHPDIELEILPSYDLVDLRADGIDVAIRFGRGHWPGTDATQLVYAGLVVALSPKLVEGRRITCLADLKGLTWLLDVAHSEERVFAKDNGIDLDSEKTISFATTQLSREAARAGLGIVIQPEPLLMADIEAGRLTLLCRQDDSAAAYHVLTRPGVISTRRDAFVKWLLRQAETT